MLILTADKTEKYLIEVLHLETGGEQRDGKKDSICIKNGITPGFNAIDDGPEYKINEDPMDKVDKALATPFPRDVEKIEDEKYEDVMHRVVNHAHQRNPNKKWSQPTSVGFLLSEQT